MSWLVWFKQKRYQHATTSSNDKASLTLADVLSAAAMSPHDAQPLVLIPIPHVRSCSRLPGIRSPTTYRIIYAQVAKT